ncbi:hypothetical protein V6N11_038418 [Hibiscus sabdariffa]|uniref:Uncharacterized protein n=1 Tax=Hibiscus sabdariffa TaxID=183260 RepID=A0ABR2SKK1_9ROSI
MFHLSEPKRDGVLCNHACVIFENRKEIEFFTEYGEANMHKTLEVIRKGSYGVVCAALDMHTGEIVAIYKENVATIKGGRRSLTKEDIKELLYREILEYHPQQQLKETQFSLSKV